MEYKLKDVYALVNVLKYCKTCGRNHIVSQNKRLCPFDKVTKLVKERKISNKKVTKPKKPKAEVVLRKATAIDEAYYKPKKVIVIEKPKDLSILEKVVVNNVEEPSLRYKVGYVYKDGSSNIRNKIYFKHQLPSLINDIKRNPNRYDRYGHPVVKINIIEIKVEQLWKNKPLRQVYATIVKSISIS